MNYYVTVMIMGTTKVVMRVLYKSSIEGVLRLAYTEYPDLLTDVRHTSGSVRNRYGQELPSDMEIRGDMVIFIH